MPETDWPYWVEWENGSLPLPEPHAAPVPETVPSVPICAHWVAAEPKLEMMREVVEATPPLVIWNLVAVDEPMTKAGAVPRSLVGLMEKRPYGVEDPMPIFPPPNTVKSSAPVLDATVKSLVSGFDAVEVETASCENGVVVPMPIAEVVAERSFAVGWVQAS